MSRVGRLHGGQLVILWVVTAVACPALVFFWLVLLEGLENDRYRTTNPVADSIVAEQWDRKVAEGMEPEVATRITSTAHTKIESELRKSFDREHTMRRRVINTSAVAAGVLPFFMLAVTWNWLGDRAARRQRRRRRKDRSGRVGGGAEDPS